jgi:hypothetical protein
VGFAPDAPFFAREVSGGAGDVFLTSNRTFLYFIPRFRAPDGRSRLGNSRISWIALNLALSPCPLAARNLLERFREPGVILSAGAGALAEVPGVTPRLAARLRDPRLLDAAAAELRSAERQSIRILIRDDPEFPGILAHQWWDRGAPPPTDWRWRGPSRRRSPPRAWWW